MNGDDNAYWRGFEARLEKLEDVVRDLDEILRGDRRKKVIGLLAEQDRMDTELRKVNAVLFQDPTGQKGLLHDIDVLMGRRKYDTQTREYKWKMATEIIVRILALVGVLLLGWDKLEPLYLKIVNQKPSLLEQKIERAKRPKGKKIYRVRVLSPEGSESTKESPQNQL